MIYFYLFFSSFYEINFLGLFVNEKEGYFFLIFYTAFAGFYINESSFKKNLSSSSKFYSLIILYGIDGFF